MKKIATIMAFLLCTNAFASGGTTVKQADTIQNSTGGSAISVPSVGSTFATDSNTLTLSNKTISSPVLSGTVTGTYSLGGTPSFASPLGVGSGGSGAASFTAHGVLFGEGSSAFGVSAAPLQYQSLIGNASGDASFQALNLAQSAAVTGILGHANGGSDASSLAGGAANFLGSLANSTTSGYFLEYNGSNYVFAAVPSVAPSLNGGSASAASITAAGGISLSSISYANEIWVVGSPGAVTVTATPSVTACTADGQQLKIHGTDNTKTVKLQDQSSLSGSGLWLNGPVTLAAQQSIQLHCDVTLGGWVEDSRSN